MIGHSWYRHRAVLAGGVIVFVLAAACSGPRSGASVTGEVSGCAAVLPLANQIVHDEGALTLVRRIGKNEADALSRTLEAIPPAPPHARSPRAHHSARSNHPAQSNHSGQARWPKACLVVYHGNYPQGTITGASPPAVAGHYALIVLRIRHPAVDRILITDRLPRELSG